MVSTPQQLETTLRSAHTNGNTHSTEKVNNWPAVSRLFGIDSQDIFDGSESTTPESTTGIDPADTRLAPIHTTAGLNGITLVTKGSFNVEAGSQIGTWFQNLSDKSATVKFTANGRWSYENGTYYSAKGHPSTKLNNGLSQGCLVLYRHTSDAIEYIGQDATKTLNPMDMVYFRCNDDVFLDNMGSVTVDWELQSLG